MPEWKKPLPTVVGETRTFWEGCRRGELLIQKCNSCGEYQFYPRGICANCFTTELAWVKASGKGKVWTFTVTYKNGTPGFAEEVPYVVALVELDEGGVKMFTNIIQCNPSDVRIGMPVEIAFVKATDEITIPYFKPVSAN